MRPHLGAGGFCLRETVMHGAQNDVRANAVNPTEMRKGKRPAYADIGFLHSAMDRVEAVGVCATLLLFLMLDVDALWQ